MISLVHTLESSAPNYVENLRHWRLQDQRSLIPTIVVARPWFQCHVLNPGSGPKLSITVADLWIQTNIVSTQHFRTTSGCSIMEAGVC